MPRGGAPRTLIVGPIGSRPWITRNELVADLEALGHDVIVNGFDADALIPPLEPVPSALGRARNSLPSMATWLARMFLRWRRTAHRNLAAAEIDHVLVWDPILAGLCRTARPKGVVVTWVVAPPEGPRLYQRVAHAALTATADRVVSSWSVGGRFSARNTVVVPWPLPGTSATPRLDRWVVIGSQTLLTEDACRALRDLASVEPAAAVVFDSREPDRVLPSVVDAIVGASGAEVVLWSAGDEWVDWLGGVPARAYDPDAAFAVDHRHLRVLADGGSLFALGRPPSGGWSDALSALKWQDGWTELVPATEAAPTSSDRSWAASVFAPSGS